MLFDPIESFEDSPIQFTVEAHLEDSPFEQGLQSLENRVKSSTALEDKRIIIESYVNLNDIDARRKLSSLYIEIDKTINLAVNSKIDIESSNLNNTIALQNGIFTKNLEKILKDANKESFLSKIGSVITAPIRALGASANQIVKGSLFAVGEAAVKPYQKVIRQKSLPITQLVGKQSERSIQTLSMTLARFSGYESTSKFRKETFNKIENLTDFNPRKIFKAVKKFEDNFVSVMESFYVEKDSKTAISKVQKYTKEIIEQPLETLFEMAGVALRISSQPFRIRKRVELLNTIKEAELMVDDILSNMSQELKNEIKKAKGVHFATGGINYDSTADNALFSANLTKKLTPGYTTIPVRNTYSNDVNTLGNIFNLTKDIPKLLDKNASSRAPMPFDRLLQTAIETGRNKDSVTLLANALAVRKLDPEKPIIITGTSGGSALVEETIGAAERAKLKNIKGVGLTLPMVGLTNTASKENFKSFFGTLDNIGIAFLAQRFRPQGGVSRKAWDDQIEKQGFPLPHTGLLKPSVNTVVFPGIGTDHHLGKFVGNKNVQAEFGSFTGLNIDPKYASKVSHVIPQLIYDQSEALERTHGVIRNESIAREEVKRGKFSFVDPTHPEWRRDNDLKSAIDAIENQEKEMKATYKKLSDSDKKLYKSFLDYLKELKRELTKFYEAAEIQGKDISKTRPPQSLIDLSKKGDQFTQFRKFYTEPEYIPIQPKIPLGQTSLFDFKPTTLKSELIQPLKENKDNTKNLNYKDLTINGNLIVKGSFLDNKKSVKHSIQQDIPFTGQTIPIVTNLTVNQSVNRDLIKNNSLTPLNYNTNKLNTKLNNSLSTKTADNMQFNYVQSKLYNGNVQATTSKAEVSTPLNDLVNDFVKYGRFYSEKMWKDVYSIITNNAVNLGLDTLVVEQAFTNLNKVVNKTTNQSVSLSNSLKQLETLMVGNLADKYRQTIKNSISESSSLALGYGQTQLKILTNNLYASLSSGINNAIDNSDKYKSIISYNLDRLYVKIINDFQNLSEIERSNFEKLPFKLAYIAKFLIQAGTIAQTQLALPGQALGSQLGAQVSLPMGQALDGLGGILGSIPLKGEALQASVDIFRAWFVHAFTQIGSTIGGAALSAAEVTAVIPIENVVQNKLKQFSAERENTPALPGSSKKLVDELIKTKDDFENKIFESKSSSAIIDDLEKFSNIPAKKLYKVAQGVGSGISARASKKDIIKELRDIDPNLEDLQFAVSKVYTEVKGISNEERKEITNKYNKLVSKVRQERQTLITSSLPEDEIIDGLKSLNNELYRFKKSFNISSGQINSILRLQEGIGKDINRFVEPSTSTNSFVMSSLEQPEQVVKPKVEYQPEINTDNAKVKYDAQYTGRMFSKGVEEGINQGKDEALQDVLVLAKSLIIVAQNALEIKSPSNVSDKKVGLPFVQGISRAIQKGKSLLKNSILDLASSFIVDSENAFKAKVNPEIYVTGKSLQNSDRDVINSNPIDNIVKDLHNQVINLRPNFEEGKYIQDLVKDLNKQVRLNAPKIETNDDPWEQYTNDALSSYQKTHKLIQSAINNQPLITTFKSEIIKDPFLGSYKIPKNNEDRIKSKIVQNDIRSSQGLNRVNRPILLPLSISEERNIYRSKGIEGGQIAIKYVENAYKNLTNTINHVIDKTKQFINGNKEIQRSVGYVQGLAENWNEAKDKLGNYLSQFQVFGIQGSTFAKLGLGVIGIFAFAKGVEYLKNQLTELIEVSRQSSKVEQFFKDATSKPKENIERIENFADKVGLDKLSLLQSSAEQTIGLKTVGYDENKALSIVDKLTKVSVGRKFNAEESSRFFRPILQLASKDKFSLEEIQQQLADIGIYGAPKLAAKATGFGNNQATFLKAVSQGEVSANIVGKDGLTNLERFVKLLEKTYGSSNELEQLVLTTTRINNNFKQLQINAGKSVEPLLQFSDPIINGSLTLLSNNINSVIGGIKMLGIVSISLAVPALFKMATSSKLLAGAFALVNEQGIRGAISTTIGASKWAKWGLAATAAISSVNSFQSTYINNTNDAIKALDKLIKKENERKNPSNQSGLNKFINSENLQNRKVGYQYAMGGMGDAISSALSLDANGVIDAFKKSSIGLSDVILGNKVSSSAFGADGIDSLLASKDQNKNRQERDKGKEVINQSQNDIIEAKKIAQNLKEGKFVDPERLKNSQTKIAELNDAFKRVSPIVKENDKGIKDFSITLEKLDDDLFNISVQGRNLTAEMNRLKTQLEENKLVSLKIDLDTEVNKLGLSFSDTKINSLYDFSSEQKKLDTELELQEKLAKAANEKYNSVDYQNLLNSPVEGQLEKANQIKSDALQEQQRLIELQISKQKSVNNRKKELFNQEKEELMFINSSRKLKNEISESQNKNDKRLQIFNKTGNLDTVQSKFELAKLNVDSILNQSSQNSLAIDDNEKLYKKGLISTYEYQTNLLEGRKKQVELEGQFNDSLIELNNIEKEKASILLDLTSKQKEYDNKLKDNSLTISQTIIDSYGKIKKEIRNLNSEINNLTSESLNDLSSVLTDKIGVIKNIFSNTSDIKGNEYALKSYLGTLERISGIRINKDKLSDDSDGEYQAKLLFQIEVSKVNIQIQGLRLKKESLIEELVIQRKILDIEQQKARFNANQDVERAQVNLQKAQIKKDPNEIALAQIDLNSALKNRDFLTDKQNIERRSQIQLDELKLRSLDIEGAKLSLGLKKDLIGNENLKPFSDVDPYKQLSDFISRNLRPFENSYQYQKNMTSEVKYQPPLPQLNITNNFNGAKQDNLDYGNIGRQIGAEAVKAFQTYRSGIVNSVK